MVSDGILNGHLTLQKWNEKALSDQPRSLEHPPPRDKMSPIELGCPIRQPITFSFTDYLATFAHLQGRTRIIGKGNLFNLAIHLTNSTKLHWKDKQPVVKEFDSKLTFFWSYERRMVAVFRNAGSPIDWLQSSPGSRIGWVPLEWKEVPRCTKYTKSDSNCIRSLLYSGLCCKSSIHQFPWGARKKSIMWPLEAAAGLGGLCLHNRLFLTKVTGCLHNFWSGREDEWFKPFVDAICLKLSGDWRHQYGVTCSERASADNMFL